MRMRMRLTLNEEADIEKVKGVWYFLCFFVKQLVFVCFKFRLECYLFMNSLQIGALLPIWMNLNKKLKTDIERRRECKEY